MAVIFNMPGGAAGESVYDGLTKVTGSGQTVAYSYSSSLAGQPGDMVFGINNTNGNYVTTALTVGSGVIRSRYYINPAAMTFGTTEQFNISYFRGTSFTNRTHRMYIGTSSSAFYIVPLSYAEGSTSIQSDFIAANKEPLFIEEEFLRSSAFGVTDAQYTVWLNDAQVYQRTGFANYDSFNLVNQVWLGAAAEIDAGTSGSLAMGKITITNDANPIGPITLGNPQLYLRRRRRSE